MHKSMALRHIPTHLVRLIRAYRKAPPLRGHLVLTLNLPLRPLALAVSSRNQVFMTESSGHYVYAFAPNFALSHLWGGFGHAAGQFNCPAGIAVSANDEVVVADGGNHRVQVFRADGTFVRQWGTWGEGDGQFTAPQCVAVTKTNEVVVTEQLKHLVQVFRLSDGAFLRRWVCTGWFLDSGYPVGVAVTDENEVCTRGFRRCVSSRRRYSSQKCHVCTCFARMGPLCASSARAVCPLANSVVHLV